jgi:hypothetical protein
MKWVDVKAIPTRVKLLVTRKFTWVDQEDGSERVVKESFSHAWAMLGVHSRNWWWVRRWGELDCGCTRNPLTRRVIMFDWECGEHSSFAKPYRYWREENEHGTNSRGDPGPV